jgi:histidyl-tRNA synthetase
MGETSDVVSKEMFSFETRGGEGVTLRPEFTAGIARAFISNGMQQNLPLKLFSTGPLFRYERPQKGRQRQFHQVNFEWLGDDSWQADVEVILAAAQLLYILTNGASVMNCTLLINTLGEAESRAIYRDELVKYLTPYTEQLSQDSKRRLLENPLRILDSKDAGDQKILEHAPKITNYLSDEAQRRIDKVVSVLNESQSTCEVKISPTLVRGLDYYNGIVFEFVSNSGDLGAQNTVLAGGRYDGLIEQMGGKQTPAIGFAAGVERLSLLLSDVGIFVKNIDLKIHVLPFEEISEKLVYRVISSLRYHLAFLLNKISSSKKCSVDIVWLGSIKKRMEKAAKQGATHVIFFAPDEAKNDCCIIKYMKTGTEKKVAFEDLGNLEKLKEIFEIG